MMALPCVGVRSVLQTRLHAAAVLGHDFLHLALIAGIERVEHNQWCHVLVGAVVARIDREGRPDPGKERRRHAEHKIEFCDALKIRVAGPPGTTGGGVVRIGCLRAECAHHRWSVRCAIPRCDRQ